MIRRVKDVPEYSKPNRVQSCISPSVVRSTSYEICRPIILLGQVLGVISWDASSCWNSHHHYPGIQPITKYPRQPFQNQHGCHFGKRTFSILYKSLTAVVLIFIGLGRTKQFVTKNYSSTLSALTRNAVNVADLMFMFSVFVFCWLEEKRFFGMLKLLENFDYLLEAAKIRKWWFLFKLTALQWIFTILLVAAWVVYDAVEEQYNTELLVCNILVLYFVFLEDIFITLFFTVSAHLCAECFSSLNNKLKTVVALEEAIMSEHLEQLRICYNQLYRLAASVQDTFSELLTIQLMRLTILLCTMSYKVLSVTKFEVKYTPFVMSITVFTYRIYTTAAAADAITNKARFGLEHLHNVRLKNLPLLGYQVIMVLANKLSHSPIEITAAGSLFRVTRGTFTTIMGTILTYLIVLMQFQNSNSAGEMKGNDKNTSVIQT